MSLSIAFFKLFHNSLNFILAHTRVNLKIIKIVRNKLVDVFITQCVSDSSLIVYNSFKTFGHRSKLFKNCLVSLVTDLFNLVNFLLLVLSSILLKCFHPELLFLFFLFLFLFVFERLIFLFHDLALFLLLGFLHLFFCTILLHFFKFRRNQIVFPGSRHVN